MTTKVSNRWCTSPLLFVILSLYSLRNKISQTNWTKGLPKSSPRMVIFLSPCLRFRTGNRMRSQRITGGGGWGVWAGRGRWRRGVGGGVRRSPLILLTILMYPSFHFPQICHIWYDLNSATVSLGHQQLCNLRISIARQNKKVTLNQTFYRKLLFHHSCLISHHLWLSLQCLRINWLVKIHAWRHICGLTFV